MRITVLQIWTADRASIRASVYFLLLQLGKKIAARNLKIGFTTVFALLARRRRNCCFVFDVLSNSLWCLLGFRTFPKICWPELNISPVSTELCENLTFNKTHCFPDYFQHANWSVIPSCTVMATIYRTRTGLPILPQESDSTMLVNVGK
mgnify:CR=1 FL=1